MLPGQAQASDASRTRTAKSFTNMRTAPDEPDANSQDVAKEKKQSTIQSRLTRSKTIDLRKAYRYLGASAAAVKESESYGIRCPSSSPRHPRRASASDAARIREYNNSKPVQLTQVEPFGPLHLNASSATTTTSAASGTNASSPNSPPTSGFSSAFSSTARMSQSMQATQSGTSTGATVSATSTSPSSPNLPAATRPASQQSNLNMGRAASSSPPTRLFIPVLNFTNIQKVDDSTLPKQQQLVQVPQEQQQQQLQEQNKLSQGAGSQPTQLQLEPPRQEPLPEGDEDAQGSVSNRNSQSNSHAASDSQQNDEADNDAGSNNNAGSNSNSQRNDQAGNNAGSNGKRTQGCACLVL